MIPFDRNSSHESIFHILQTKAEIDAFNTNVIGSYLFSYDDDFSCFEVVTVLPTCQHRFGKSFTYENNLFSCYEVGVSDIESAEDLATSEILLDPNGVLACAKTLLCARQEPIWGSNQFVFDEECKKKLPHIIEQDYPNLSEEERTNRIVHLLADLYTEWLQQGMSIEEIAQSKIGEFFVQDESCHKKAVRIANARISTGGPWSDDDFQKVITLDKKRGK